MLFWTFGDTHPNMHMPPHTHLKKMPKHDLNKDDIGRHAIMEEGTLMAPALDKELQTTKEF